MDAPGDCSPSRKVVSKMMSLSAIWSLLVLMGWPATSKFWRPKQKARCGCIRAFVEKVCACAYRLRPWGDSSRASANIFMRSNVAQVFYALQPSPVQAPLVGLVGRVLITLLCCPLALRHAYTA
jgi:hypothetical protein